MIAKHIQPASTLFALLFLLTLNPGSTRADSPAETSSPSPTAQTRYVFGLSPFLDHASKERVFRHVVRFLLEDAPCGSTLHAVDAFHIQTIATLDIPAREAFASPKTRTTQFREPIQQIRRFLAAEPQRPASPGLNFEHAIRLPQLLDFVSRNLTAPDRTVVVAVLGSPLYQDDKEPGFSMTQGYFPSDGHLLAARDKSVFGLQGREHALEGVQVVWGYFGEPWANELHRDKISRFWTLYVQRQGGRLGTFTGDLPTAFHSLRAPGPTTPAPEPLPPLDLAQTKIEMLRITRDVGTTDWITQEELRDPARTPPTSLVGPMKIGIRWKGDIDLDLYARPNANHERLYFEHPRSPEGYYDKDHRSSPGREYEFIEFLAAVDLRKVHAAINFYGGELKDEASGEIRIEFENRIYSSPFSIPASRGNSGREGAAQARYWTTIDIPRMLHFPEDIADRR